MPEEGRLAGRVAWVEPGTYVVSCLLDREPLLNSPLSVQCVAASRSRRRAAAARAQRPLNGAKGARSALTTQRGLPQGSQWRSLHSIGGFHQGFSGVLHKFNGDFTSPSAARGGDSADGVLCGT